MIAINPKVLYHFQVRVFEGLFAKRGVRQGLLSQRNQSFLLTLKEKISVKGHFIDDSNEYKFRYVPSSSSCEKKALLTSAGLYFTPAKV